MHNMGPLMNDLFKTKLFKTKTLSALPILFLALLLPEQARSAPTQWPDASVPACNYDPLSQAGNLQECISYYNALSPPVAIQLEIVGDANHTRVIDRDILVFLSSGVSSFSLSPQRGTEVVFTAAHSLEVHTHPSTAATVAVEGLVFAGGNLRITHNTDGMLPGATSFYSVRGNRLQAVASDTCGIEFTNEPETSASVHEVVGNVIESNAGNGAGNRFGICFLKGQQNAQNIRIEGNRIESKSGDFASAIDLSRGALPSLDYYSIRGNLTVSNNQLRNGQGFGDGIRLRQVPTAGPLWLRMDNNAFTDWGTYAINLEVFQAPGTPNSSGGLDRYGLELFNNSWTAGDLRLRHTGTAGGQGAISARLLNNLAANGAGFGLIGLSPDLHDRIFARNNISSALGGLPAHNPPDMDIQPLLVIEPRLESPLYPRPQAGSPAINGGTALPGFADAAQAFDVDGERRVAGGVIDIGAYEFNTDRAGQFGFYGLGNTAAVTNLGNLGNEEVVVATPVLQEGTGTALPILGIFRDMDLFRLYNEAEGVDLPAGLRFHVLKAGTGKRGFRQVSAPSPSDPLETPITGDGTSSSAVHIMLHRWDDPSGALAPQYHNRIIGLRYGGSPTQFFIHDESNPRLAMPADLGFNVVRAPTASPNAFETVTDAVPVAEQRLAHPLLDGNPCAAPVAGYVQNQSEPAGTVLALRYRPGTAGGPGHWFAAAASPNPGLLGNPTQFLAQQGINVLLDGAQANRCRLHGELFMDGFEG